MNQHEALALLRFAKACCPALKIDEYTPDAWGLIFDDVPFKDAKEAVVTVVKREKWIDPSTVRSEVKAIRSERLKRYEIEHGHPRIPQWILDLDEPDHSIAWREWRQRTKTAIADGNPPTQEEIDARPAGHPMPAIEGTFKEVPRA